MNNNEETGHYLELVRSPERPADDVEIIDEYCNQLIRERGNGLVEAGYAGHSAFLEDDREWTDAYLRRGNGWYRIEYFDGSIPNSQKFMITMHRYRSAYPGATPPKGVEWVIYRDDPEGNPTDFSYDPGVFREHLEETFGPLPEKVQKRLGVQAGKRRKAD